MKEFILISLLVLLTNTLSFANMPNDNDNKVVMSTARMPQFPGGEKALINYIKTHLIYPQSAQDNNIEGKVVVQFVVTKTGEIGEVKVLNSVEESLDNEAIRVCKSLPKFTPGYNAKGDPVNVWYTVPFNFYIVGNETQTNPKTQYSEEPAKYDPTAGVTATVLGIRFGSSFSTVKSALQSRFGYSSVTEKSGILEVDNPRLGNSMFSLGTFDFQRSGNESYLNFADFQQYYSLKNESSAISDRDFLFSLIKEKYPFTEQYVNKDGYKCYRFGINPKDINCSLGVIYLVKGLGKDGVKRLYLHLQYGPIFFIDKLSDF